MQCSVAPASQLHFRRETGTLGTRQDERTPTFTKYEEAMGKWGAIKTDQKGTGQEGTD